MSHNPFSPSRSSETDEEIHDQEASRHVSRASGNYRAQEGKTRNMGSVGMDRENEVTTYLE